MLNSVRLSPDTHYQRALDAEDDKILGMVRDCRSLREIAIAFGVGEDTMLKRIEELAELRTRFDNAVATLQRPHQ